MPWPILFGPLPSIITFFLSVGFASHAGDGPALPDMLKNGRSYVEYRYGVYASNSAAQVSTVLKTGTIPASFKAAFISSSVLPEREARAFMEKPASLAF